MQEKEDLRIRRTKILLSNALIELMQNTPYNKISVNDICDKAMVHRATFYNHFYDKDDLFDYVLESISEELFEKAKKDEEFNTTKEMYLSLISSCIDFLTENKNKICCILNNFNGKLFKVVVETLKRSAFYYSGKIKDTKKYVIPKEILINFFIGGLSFVGFNILEDNLKYDKKELMEYCDILLNENSLLIAN